MAARLAGLGVVREGEIRLAMVRKEVRVRRENIVGGFEGWWAGGLVG